MWNNCIKDADRMWMTRRACAFVLTPYFALLADRDGVRRSMYDRFGGSIDHCL